MFFKYSRDRHLAGQASGRKLKVLLSGALCAVMIFNPPTSSAQESDRLLSIDKIYTQRQSSFGAFTQKVPIEVPQYYGLEPSLSLSYSSSRVNSYGSEDVIGAGWRLNGLSRIKRGSPGMGAPFFNDLDQYFLDGERLVSCPEEGKKAGCAAGGSHASWVENYLRIKRLQEPNLWQVTLKNGTVLEYAPVSTWGTYDAQSAEAKKQATEYEWLLAKRTDTLGHQVNYSYSCTALPQCYISSVSYKTSSITFHWGNRPDPITYGVGYQIGQIDKRLTAVEVSTSGRRARAYSLSYKQSATTARSLLTKVQEYGKDATISNGVVTAGTKLPAFSFAYKDDVGAGVKKLSPSVSGDSYIDDIDSDRIIDSVKLNRTKKKQGRDDYTYTCKLETSSSLPDKTISCSHFSKSYLKIARNNNKKKKDVLVLYDYIHEYETSKGRIRKRTYSNLPHAAYSKESVIADFDGDGNDDVLSSKGQLFSLSPTSKWSNFHEDVSAMDINGDGLADLVRPYKNRELKTYLSNGTNAFINGPILSKLDTKNLTDLNGDGLIDGYIPESSGDIQVYYGAGLKFIKGPKLHASALGSLSDFRAADFDGDGRADYVANRKGDHTNLYLSRGNSLHRQRGSEDTNFIRNYDTKYLIDLNGDGFSEIVTRKGWRFQFVSERPDMLVGVVLPSGGQLSASYTTYGGDTDDERWFPPVLTVLASLTEKPNSSQAFTTRFAYSGGRWDFDNRRFAGFKKIITTLPKLAGETKAPTVETTYRQDVSSVGKIAQRIWKDGNGTILRKQVQEYATQNDNEPYTSLNTASLTYSYDEGVERVQKTTRIFNSYGQAKHRTNHGDTAKSGDERTYTRWSYPNKDKYIINKWAVEAINSFDDYDYTDRRAWRRWHYYDEKPIKTPPTKGLKTQTFQWAGGDKDNRLSLSRDYYDSHGNLVEQRNALNETISYVYDPQYNLFPEQERSPLFHAGDARHVIRTSWDKTCGVPLTQTDVNGKVTQYQYDALCRLVRTDYPDGGFEALAYVNWGNPHTQHIVKTSTPATGSTPVTSREYYDGLGRVWKSEQEVGSGKSVRELTGYNARGQVAWVKQLHEPGSEPQPVTYVYDALDRQIMINHGDGTSTRYAYKAGPEFRSVEVTDALGHKASTHFDAHGNEVRRIKVRDGQQLITRMEYDALNQLTKVTDPAGSVWTYRYDGLGNQVSATDPNLGIWTKEYDRANRIIKQTDNKGQVTTYSYDKAGRTKTRKVVSVTGNLAPIVAKSLTNQSAYVGGLWNFTVPTETFADHNGDSLSVSARLQGGQGLPQWLSFQNNRFSGTPPQAAVGDLQIQVIADDGQAQVAAPFTLAIAQNAPIMGTSANETLKGTAATDVIHGLAGNDKLYGYAGNDKLYGGDNNDILYSGSGADLLDGGSGSDRADYSLSPSGVSVNMATGVMSGGDAEGDILINIEHVYGSHHNDVIVGNDGGNALYAGRGIDRLSGGKGNDTLNAYHSGADTLDGGEGTDTVRYYYASSGVTVNLADPSQNTGDAAGDTYTSIERIMGTRDHADTLIGDAGHNKIYGYGGADTLDGGPGNDILSYGGSPTGVSVNLTTGAVSGGHAEGDKISNFETIEGSSYNDVLIGDEQNNSFYGHRGNDRLEGKGGNDTLNAYGGGNDYLDGGPGIDVARYRWSKHALTINLADPSQNTGDAAGDTYVSIENATGSDAYGDSLTGDSGNNRLSGYGGNDTLNGAAGNDNLHGGKGNDTFIFEGPFFGRDVIEDFEHGFGFGDKARFDKLVFANFDHLMRNATQQSGNLVIKLNDSNTVTLRNIRKADLKASNFEFVSASSAYTHISTHEVPRQSTRYYKGCISYLKTVREETYRYKTGATYVRENGYGTPHSEGDKCTRSTETKERYFKADVYTSNGRGFVTDRHGKRIHHSLVNNVDGPYSNASITRSSRCITAKFRLTNYFETIRRQKIVHPTGSVEYTDGVRISTRTTEIKAVHHERSNC